MEEDAEPPWREPCQGTTLRPGTSDRKQPSIYFARTLGGVQTSRTVRGSTRKEANAVFHPDALSKSVHQVTMPHPARERLLQAAIDRHRAGDLDGAAAAYGHLLAANPADADALNLLGVALHQQGRTEAALERLHAAVKARRKDAGIHYNLGTVFIDAGRYAEAEAALRAALKLGGRDPHLEMNLANALALQGKAQAALPFYRVACRRTPRSAAVWYNYGNALRDAGDTDAALAAYREAIAAEPHESAAWTNLGQLLHRLQRLAEAEDAYRQVLTITAGDAAIHTSLAQILLHQGRYDEAASQANRALDLEPDNVNTLVVSAEIERSRFDYPNAEARLHRAAALDPSRVDVRIKLAQLVRDAGRPAEALAHYDAMTAAPPSSQDEIALGRAVTCMALGRYDEAWPGMQSRIRRERLLQDAPNVPWAMRTLPRDLTGRRVYVQREQGLGDELLFLRYLPELRVRGARVLYRCGEKLEGLLRRAQAAEEIGATLDPPADADHYLSVGDLPWALEAGIRTPGVARSLQLEPPPERVEAMRARLAGSGAPPYIGLTWHAGMRPEWQPGIKGRVPWKRIAPDALGSALRAANGTLIAMQRNPIDADIETLATACGRAVHDFSAWSEDLDDALALLAALDDYIAVSNTNMHLLAGIGRTARVLLHFPPEWRWLAPAGDSPFFPGFALYAQAPDGSWAAALERLRADLATLRR